MAQTPIPGFDQALEEIRPGLAEPLVWLVPDDEKHFDGISILVGLGTVLLTAFLSGFTEEAQKHAKAAGGAAARWLAEQLKSVGGLGTEPPPAAVAEAASEAPRLALPAGEQAAALAGAEGAIAAVLAEHMPAGQAAAVAGQVRAAISSHVLPAGAAA